MKLVIYLTLFLCLSSCGKVNCPEPVSSVSNLITKAPSVPTDSNLTNPADSNLTKGLIAFYNFDGNANDASGNNINGIIQGNPALGKNRFGHDDGAYYFDGIDDYINICDSLLFKSTQWTYASWVNVTSYPSINSNAFILALGGTGGAQALAINNAYTQNKQGFITASYHAPGNTPTICIEETLPTLNTWYHVVGVRETDTLRLFINGTEVIKTKTLSSDISYGNPFFYANIGARNNSTEFFNGYMDDLRIYSRPLNSSEIYELYILPEAVK